MSSFRMRPKSRHDIHLYSICALAIEAKRNFIQYFKYTCILATTHHTKSGAGFSTCAVISLLKSCHFLGHFRLDFQIRDAFSMDEPLESTINTTGLQTEKKTQNNNMICKDLGTK